jgi:hypothetical protein
VKINDVEELIDMMPHPDIHRAITAERLADMQRAPVRGRRVVRNRLGLLLLAAGERLTAEAHVVRAPRRALG